MTMRKVYLKGHLAEGIPDTLTLSFSTPADAIRLIELNYPGFIRKLKEGWYRVVALREDIGNRVLNPENLRMGFTGDLSITPVPGGSASGRKKGLLGAILGAVIVGAAFFFSGGALATALPGFLGAAGATYGSVAQLGIGLALSGIATALTPTPSTDYSEVEENRSFVFNGPVNLTQPGGVVPVVYGLMLVGTYTVSTALDSEVSSKSVSITSQQVLDSQFTIYMPAQVVTVDMDDLVREDVGSTITHFGGQVIAGVTNITSGSLSVVVNPAAAGGVDLITITHDGGALGLAGSSQAVTHSFTYTVLHDGVSYDGTLHVYEGRGGVFVPSFGEVYEDGIEVTGNAE